MRNTNCGNTRREIEEAAPGGSLSSSVNSHLMNCVACATFSREQSKLRQMVSSLGTVEAPGDFDFRLRARLAGEKPGSARAFPAFSIGHLSFGLPAAAVAAMVLAIGLAFVFANLKSQPSKSLSVSVPTTEQPARALEAGPDTLAVKSGTNETTSKSSEESIGTDAASNGSDHLQAKRRNPRLEVATQKDRNITAQDFSSAGAQVLTPNNQVAGTYPTAAFPIDASYQSLKVSVDNGRGASRTISLPTVSFGSNQALSQDGSQLMASTRGAW